MRKIGQFTADGYSCLADYVINPCALRVFKNQRTISPSLSVFVEDGHASRPYAERYLADAVRNNNYLMGNNATIIFATKEKAVLLQAADILCWQATKYIKDLSSGSRPPRKDFQYLLGAETNLFYVSTDAVASDPRGKLSNVYSDRSPAGVSQLGFNHKLYGEFNEQRDKYVKAIFSIGQNEEEFVEQTHMLYDQLGRSTSSTYELVDDPSSWQPR